MPATSVMARRARSSERSSSHSDSANRNTTAAPSVPYAMDLPDRVRKERYFDPEFYALECERLWPRVWQMACRLEEIPSVGDAVEYQILDQSVVVVRTGEGEEQEQTE